MKVLPEVIDIDGVKVALYTMSSIEVVVVNVDFKAGSAYESSKQWGAVHFMEHMVHEGTKRFPTRLDLEAFKEENGLRQNASTSGTCLSFEASFPTVSMKAGFTLLQEIIAHPTVPENELSKEKDVVIQEYRDKWSQPNSRFWRAKVKAYYGADHMVARDALGQPEYIQSLSRADVLKVYEQSVNANTMTVTVVGNFKKASLLPLLQNLVKDVKRGDVRVLALEAPKPTTHYLWHKEDMDKASLEIMFFAPPRAALSQRERMVMRIGSYMLGGSSRSRIFKRLRGELGIAYSAGSGMYFAQNASEFYLMAGTSPEKAMTARDELLREFQKVKDGDITDEEFARALKFINLSTLTGYDSPYNINETLSTSLFWDGEVYTPEHLIEIANTIKKEEIPQLYEKYISKTPILSVMSREDPQLSL